MGSDGSIIEETKYDNLLIAECYIANKKTREERSLLRLRTNLVQDRTRVVNGMHSLLDKYDMNFGLSKIFGIKGLQWLRDLSVIGNDQILLQEYISQIDFLTTERDRYSNNLT